MRSTLRCALVATAVIVAHSRPSFATDTPVPDETPSQRYARHSISIFASPELSAPNSATARVLFDGVVRATFLRGFAAQLRLGLGFSFSTLASASELNFRPGVGIGYAIPLSRSVALTPNVGYDVFVASSVFAAGTLITQRVGVEIPVAVAVDSTLVEPFLLAGATFFQGQPDLALAVGVRIGLMFSTTHRPLPPPAPPPSPPIANPSATNMMLRQQEPPPPPPASTSPSSPPPSEVSSPPDSPPSAP